MPKTSRFKRRSSSDCSSPNVPPAWSILPPSTFLGTTLDWGPWELYPRVVVVKGDWYIQYIICIHADWCISNCVCITMYTCMYTYYIYSIYIIYIYIYTLRLVRSYDPQSASWSGVGSKRWAPRNPKWLTSPQLIQQGKWSHRSELGFLSRSAILMAERPIDQIGCPKIPSGYLT